MALVTLSETKLHLRVDGTEEDSLIGVYITAAEQSVIATLDREVYPDSTALAAAKAAAPATLTAATAAYTAAVEAAQALADATEQADAALAADYEYLRARADYKQAMDGIVVTDAIKSAVLLIVGHLYANRENSTVGLTVSLLPNGAEFLLQPYKAY